LAELYTHGINGWVVPLKKGNPEKLKLEVDIHAFATGMTELLDNSSLRTKIARNSRKLWETNYSSQKMGNETINEYKKLINYLPEGNGQEAYDAQKSYRHLPQPLFSYERRRYVTKIKN
jgi:hypothetical protein